VQHIADNGYPFAAKVAQVRSQREDIEECLRRMGMETIAGIYYGGIQVTRSKIRRA
jgi:hypothetical protein